MASFFWLPIFRTASLLMVPGMHSALIVCIMRFILFYGRTYPFTFLFEQVLLQSKLPKTHLPLLVCPSLLLLHFPFSGI